MFIACGPITLTYICKKNIVYGLYIIIIETVAQTQYERSGVKHGSVL